MGKAKAADFFRMCLDDLNVCSADEIQPGLTSVQVSQLLDSLFKLVKTNT